SRSERNRFGYSGIIGPVDPGEANDASPTCRTLHAPAIALARRGFVPLSTGIQHFSPHRSVDPPRRTISCAYRADGWSPASVLARGCPRRPPLAHATVPRQAMRVMRHTFAPVTYHTTI